MMIRLELAVSLSQTEGMKVDQQQCHILCFGDSLTAGYSNRGLRFDPYSKTLSGLLNKQHPGMQFIATEMGVSGEKVVPKMFNRFKRLSVEPRHQGNEQRKKGDNSDSGSGAQELPFQDVMIILGGANDIGWQVDSADICKHLALMYDLALKTFGCRLLVCVTIPDCVAVSAKEELRENRDAVNAFIREYCANWQKGQKGQKGQKEKGNKEQGGSEADVLLLDFFATTSAMNELVRHLYYDRDRLHLSPAGYELLGTRLFELIQEEWIDKS